MKIGLCLPQLGPHVTLEVVRAFATRADALGYDTLWAQDHIFYPLQPLDEQPGTIGGLWPQPYRQLLSPLELLAFVAGITSSIRIGSSILVTAYHRPVALAKQAATLDLLSGGRMILGLGLGWSRDEYALMDTPFEQRGARSADFIRALRACWAPDPVAHDGPFFRIPLSETSPKPIQRDAAGNAHIPILGGFWAEAGLQRAAELCDMWQSGSHTIAEAAETGRKINRIAADKHGRGPVSTVLRVMASPQLPGLAALPKGTSKIPYWIGQPEDMLPELLQAKRDGIDEVTIDCNFFMENPGPAGWIAQPDFLAPLIAAAHD